MKKPAQSSWAASRNSSSRRLVVLGLAGVAEDERGAKRGVGFGRANRRDALEEPLPVAPAAHRAQQRPRGVLQREVEVGHARREDRLDESLR